MIIIATSNWTNKTAGKYEYSSVQASFNNELSKKIKDYGIKNINKKDLVDKGFENDTHVTILYGIHDAEPNKVKDLLKNQKPFKITLKDITLFKKDDQDVVKIDIKSEVLNSLNKLLINNLEYTSKYKEYSPHLTIAYVKKNSYKIKDKDIFKNEQFTINELIFSSKNGKKTKIKL